MKRWNLLALLVLGLSIAGCKSDKKGGDEASDAQNSISTVEESPYKEATLADLVGDFADSNYPNGELWKKFTVKSLGGEKVEVVFSSKPVNGISECNFKGIGDFREGYIHVPLNPDAEDPTFMTIRMLTNDDISVGAQGGDQENPTEVLQLFCLTSTPNTLAGIYARVAN